MPTGTFRPRPTFSSLHRGRAGNFRSYWVPAALILTATAAIAQPASPPSIAPGAQPEGAIVPPPSAPVERATAVRAPVASAPSGGRLSPPATGGYETPADFPTTMFVPAAAMSTPLYTIRATTRNNGLSNSYMVDATDGYSFEVTGTLLLFERLREIAATAQLREMKSGEEFAKSIGTDAMGKLGAVGQTLEDPGKFIESIPKGASRFFGSIGEGLKGKRDHYEGRAYSSLLGQSKAKRMLAMDLGVDPYSTNEALQKQLNRVGWSEASGNLVLNFAVSAVLPPGAGLGLNVNQNLKTMLLQEPPTQLDIINRKTLMGLGVSREVADSVLQNPWFSPGHATVITQCLADLGAGKNISAFLVRASAASNEVDARYFEQMAELIAWYHNTQAPVKEIVAPAGPLFFIDKAGTHVFPVPFDYALWTSSLQFATDRMMSMQATPAPSALLSTGAVSPRAAEAFGQRGVKLLTSVVLPPVEKVTK